MIIRNCRPGEAEREAAVYNAVAGQLPGFQPLSTEEVRRASSGRGFDPGTRLCAEEDGQVVGVATFDPSGRVSPPWCLPGHERMGHQLLGSALRGLADRKVTRAYVTCRADWGDQIEFFEDHGFDKVRDMVNFTQSIADLPTMFQRPRLNVALAREEDVAAIENLVPRLLRIHGPALASHLLRNNGLPTDAVYVLRRKDGSPLGVGLLIDDESYAEVEMLDPRASTFWLGAFGTEGLPTKRVNGLFSLLSAPGKDALSIGQDLLWYGTSRIETNTFNLLAAQAPSDAPHLIDFYERYFQKQGSFPVFEREVGTGSRF